MARDGRPAQRTPPPEVSLESALQLARQTLARWYKRGKTDFSVEHLKDSLAENNPFVTEVIATLAGESVIEAQPATVPPGTPDYLAGLFGTSYRIAASVVEVVPTEHLGLQIDEAGATIQRPAFCRHIVALSPIQLRLATAMCAGGEAGIKVSEATAIRGGERTAERQFRTSFNRCVSLLGIRLERFAWKIVEK